VLVVVDVADVERAEKVSFEPVEADGAVYSGCIAVMVVSLLVGVIVIIDVITLARTKPRRRRRPRAGPRRRTVF